MKRILLVITAVGFALVVNACCCGDDFVEGFNQGYSGAVAEEFVTMNRMMGSVEDSPEKTEVQAMLDDGEGLAREGKIGAIKTGILKETFMKAISDDKFSKSEVKQLKKLYEGAKE
jgi:hypothetical protein